MLSLSVCITGLKRWTQFFFLSHLWTQISVLVVPSLILTLNPSSLLFFSCWKWPWKYPCCACPDTELCLFFSSPSLCSVFISGLSQPAQGWPGAVLTLQAYWLWKREKIPWTWFITHEPHDTSFICSFFAMESTADKPHIVFITLILGTSAIRYTGQTN